MVNHKFDKILTILLIIISIAIVVVAGFWGYDLFQRYFLNAGAEEILEEFDKQVADLNTIEEPNVTELPINQTTENNVPNETTVPPANTRVPVATSTQRPTNSIDLKYKGYNVAGKIEIPSTKLKYPVLTVATDKSMKVSVGILYGVGLNQIGNTVIMGHNYRNGSLFSNNDKITNGDEIFITDISGTRLKYIVYNKYYTTSTDFEYGTRDTAGTREITLESCTDDGRSRIIVCAREEK